MPRRPKVPSKIALGLLVGGVASGVLSGPAHAQSHDQLKAKFRDLCLQKFAHLRGPGQREVVRAHVRPCIKAHMRSHIGAAMKASSEHVGDLIKAGKQKEAEKAARLAIAQAIDMAGGPGWPPVGRGYLILARPLSNMGRYSEAEQAARKALAIFEKTGKSEGAARASVRLANILTHQGRHAEAEALFTSSLASLEREPGPDHPATADALRRYADLRQQQGRLDEAKHLAERALVIEEKATGDHKAAIARTLRTLGSIDVVAARFAQAEEHLKRSLSIGEAVFGAQHWELAQTLRWLGQLYASTGRNNEAEPLLRRAVETIRDSVGLEHRAGINTIRVYAGVKIALNDFSGAEQILRQGISLSEKSNGTENPDNLSLAYLHLKLGHALHMLGRTDEAAKELEIGLAAAKQLGEDGHVARALLGIGRHHMAMGRFDEARPRLEQALALFERSSPNGFVVAWALRWHAELELKTRRPGNALQDLKRIVKILNARRNETLALVGERFNNEAERLLQWIALAHARASWEIDAGGATSGSDAFIGAQYESQSTAAAAITQMATRFGATDSALGKLVRDGQDLLQRWQAIDQQLTETLTAGADKSARNSLRTDLDGIGKDLAKISARIATEFPQYEALTHPAPLAVSDVRRLIGPDEAVLLFLVGDHGSFVWAVSKDRLAWQRLPFGTRALGDKVRRVRKGLDIVKLRVAASSGKAKLFDVGLAHELYGSLIAPVADVIRDKRHLLVVPSGPLTSLPFHLLVMEPPVRPISELTQIPQYRDVPWIIKQHAITILPSVASLQALRQTARAEPRGKPFVGFGNPVFGSADAREKKPPLPTAALSGTRSYSSYWRGGTVDLESLSNGLAPLPETADEVRAVAKALGAASGEVHLGAAASETAIKQADLSPYRVVYFATHGLVAGELKGLAEPALAFTTPAKATVLDDGLLASSEVAQLKLDADWVVLSACNTAAGEKTGAEAFSGLARAFFYAGARSLLVSHWPVDSGAAVQLTTRMFEARRRHQGMRHAEALRQSMLSYLSDTSDPLNAYPAFWAPFAVVGEGEG